ncbi:J domain-containing protein [Ornithinimicrobium cavernae]|uniref:J domain-containing protein n=1 Tax=Ornithinimicrobium cavernae TaxID=2666047 RepID=UPI000D687471|nr:J domain-containing protein [Ornithinimicrobium cavernae]
MAPDPNWYEVLRVHPSALPEQIRRSYTILAQHGHPDSGGAGADMQQLRQARDVLLDPERRRAYDAQLRAQTQTGQPEAAGVPTHAQRDEWGQESVWVPPPPQGSGWQQPPPHPPGHGPVAPDGVSRAPRLSRADVLGRSAPERVTGLVWLLVSLVAPVASALLDLSLVDALTYAGLVLLSVLVGALRLTGRASWPYVVWVVVALALGAVLVGPMGQWGTGLYVLVWAAAFVGAVETRRRGR